MPFGTRFIAGTLDIIMRNIGTYICLILMTLLFSCESNTLTEKEELVDFDSIGFVSTGGNYPSPIEFAYLQYSRIKNGLIFNDYFKFQNYLDFTPEQKGILLLDILIASRNNDSVYVQSSVSKLIEFETEDDQRAVLNKLRSNQSGESIFEILAEYLDLHYNLESDEITISRINNGMMLEEIYINSQLYNSTMDEKILEMVSDNFEKIKYFNQASSDSVGRKMFQLTDEPIIIDTEISVTDSNKLVTQIEFIENDKIYELITRIKLLRNKLLRKDNV